MKIILFLILSLNIFLPNFIFCYECPNKLCGGYNIGSQCYNVWTNSYAKCMGYLNKEDKNVISCFNYFKKSNIELPDSVSINIIKDCKKINSSYRNSNEVEFIEYTINYLHARCIYKNRHNLIIKNKNITCEINDI